MTDTVTKILGAVVLLGLVLLGACALFDRPIPDPLTIITTSALSGLLGLLARPGVQGRRRRAGSATTPPR